MSQLARRNMEDDPEADASGSSESTSSASCSTITDTTTSPSACDESGSTISGHDDEDCDDSRRHCRCHHHTMDHSDLMVIGEQMCPLNCEHHESSSGCSKRRESDTEGSMFASSRSSVHDALAGQSHDRSATTTCSMLQSSSRQTTSTNDGLCNPRGSSCRITDLDRACSSGSQSQATTQNPVPSDPNHTLGSSLTNLSSTNLSQQSSEDRLALRPAQSPTPSLSTLDTNNNKNSSSSAREALSNIKRTNFSKSASGSRLINRSRPNVCDCLTHDCGERKHSNRRQFIEHYYNSRTQLPSAVSSTSSFNISTPLNKLSECDAITRRLLSSPIRGASKPTESPVRRTHISEIDRARRASLGTGTMTDQMFLLSSDPFKSLDVSRDSDIKQESDDRHMLQSECGHSGAGVPEGGGGDMKLKQQQGRSLSVCDEETLNPRLKGASSNHSPNLNRAISLACEPRSPAEAKRLLTIIPLFGCDIKSLEQFTSFGYILPPVIDSAVDHILVNGIDSVGIFRKSGVKSRILSLRQRIEANQDAKLNELNQNNEFSIYDIADLVKMWFRELKPVPPLTKELIKLISAFLGSSQNPTAHTKSGYSSHQESLFSIGRSNSKTMKGAGSSLKSKIGSMTTSTHRALLLRVLNFLSRISSHCEINQMTSQNLAICLTPSLCATSPDQLSILNAQRVLEYSIDHHEMLFE